MSRGASCLSTALGTGSCCIIITLARLLAKKKLSLFLASDISRPTLQIARQNAKVHKVNKKIKFLHGNLLDPIIKKIKFPITSRRKCPWGTNSQFLITANLPYLDTLWKNLLKSSDSVGLKYEPKIALNGGSDGLDPYRKLAEQIKVLKTKNNKIILLCEIGHLQKKEMKKIFSFGEKIKIKKDLNGLNRLAIITI